MKTKNRFCRCSFLFLGVLLFLVSSCTKDNDSNNQITDVDGNVYHSITIGTQIWMVENLKTTRFRNGEPIPNVTDALQWANLSSGALCGYNNDINNSSIYGNLYNWYAVTDTRNIAPVGWHVPTGFEWFALTQFVDHNAGKLMEQGTAHWLYNIDSDNSSGFTALPGGYRTMAGDFEYLGNNASFWTSEQNAFKWVIASPDLLMSTYDNPKNIGISIRCIKDL